MWNALPSQGYPSQGGGNNGSGSGGPEGPNGPKLSQSPYKYPSSHSREQRARFYESESYNHLPQTREKLRTIVEDKDRDPSKTFKMDREYEHMHWYGISMLDHNTVCYHFANHPRLKKYIKVVQDTGNLLYTAHINRLMLMELCKDRKKPSQV